MIIYTIFVNDMYVKFVIYILMFELNTEGFVLKKYQVINRSFHGI